MPTGQIRRKMHRGKKKVHFLSFDYTFSTDMRARD